MVSADLQTTAPAAGAADRFRRAERALWTAYGLETSERFVELQEPRVRVRVQETGTGDPVVFIGGSAGTGAVLGTADPRAPRASRGRARPSGLGVELADRLPRHQPR